MPDIHLRFHKDMLVLSAPIEEALRERGFDDNAEQQLLAATEPETLLEPLRLELIAGAQCLVLPTSGLTRARLAHIRAEDRAEQIAAATTGLIAELNPHPQHILAEIGPTGLPLDSTSKTSLVANRDQYADAARLFSSSRAEALLLGTMVTIDDLRCALMGVRKVWDGPVLACIAVDEDGRIEGKQELEWALAMMEECEADVAGIQTSALPEQAARIVERMTKACSLPILVQIDVRERDTRGTRSPGPYGKADSMLYAAETLRRSGAQFLRACGRATASYTGALFAATSGLDAVR